MKTNHSLFATVTLTTLAFLLTAIFLFSSDAQAGGRNHYYGAPGNHYYNGHDRGHRQHHRKHARQHRHNQHNHYYPQVRRDIYYQQNYYQPPYYQPPYYQPAYYQPAYGGYREIHYGGRNDFFMGLRSGNASIMIGY